VKKEFVPLKRKQVDTNPAEDNKKKIQF